MHATGVLKAVGVFGYWYTATRIDGVVNFPVSMRAFPSAIISTGTDYYSLYRAGSTDNINDLSLNDINYTCATLVTLSNASGTVGTSGWLTTNNANASIAFSAEL
jgi:hypothetical protein